MVENNTSTSGAICASGSNIASGSICVSGNSILHISGASGEYVRVDSEPYQISLYREI